MKIAIQGHPTRGKEIIKILENLGGINRLNHNGHYTNYFYYVSGDDNTIAWTCVRPQHLNVFTLEEFEKAFPFKIGDKIKHITSIGIIKEYCYIDNEPAYKVESMELGFTVTIAAKILEPYKEMKEERNITLTLDKAKEWYNKGGELKEIALQAFSEMELNSLPKSWEEYCRKYGYACLSTRYTNLSLKYDALIKLEQLRDCWRQGWVPNWLEGNVTKYVIRNWRDKISIETTYVTHSFLSFPTYEIAKKFLECFRDLIEQAGDLI
jgi:hypothetical protein